MWQTPGTHASSTFHGPHSLDAGLPQCPCPPPSAALCARIISQQRRRCRWSHPREGSHPPSPPSTLYHSFSHSACPCLSTRAACILSFFSSRHSNTKRHLSGRDKPISETHWGWVRGAWRCPPPLPSFPLISLPCSCSQGELNRTGLQAPFAPQWLVFMSVFFCMYSEGSKDSASIVHQSTWSMWTEEAEGRQQGTVSGFKLRLQRVVQIRERESQSS